jgi:hypothetical protein
MVTFGPDPVPPVGAPVVVLALLAQPVSATVAISAAASHLFLDMVAPSGVRVGE